MPVNPAGTPERPAAGYPVTMVRPHLRDIPAGPWPPGYQWRHLRVDEGDLWLEIERQADHLQTLPDGSFEREFGADLASVPQRCFVVTDAAGAGVGTISAWYYPYRGQEYGLIHWVAVHRAHQGRGIGRAMLSLALGQLAVWHEQALLNTQTARLPAIGLYLDFGFQPVLDVEGAAACWREVAGQLAHPALADLR